jgi:hypothetical protein
MLNLLSLESPWSVEHIRAIKIQTWVVHSMAKLKYMQISKLDFKMIPIGLALLYRALSKYNKT